MKATEPIVQNRRATRSFMQEVNGFRVTATQPFLSAHAEVINQDGTATKVLIAILNSLVSKAPVASLPIADPKTGRPTREFIRLMES